MYKILYLTSLPNIGGGETALLYLLSKLDRRYFEPIVVLPEKGQLSERLTNLKIKTYFLGLEPFLVRTFFIPGLSPHGILSFYKLAKKINPDLIHLNHLNLVFYAGITAKLLKIPLIATSHGPWDSYYFFQDLAAQLFVDKILPNTKDTASNLLKRKIINAKKVEVIPFGIDTNLFEPASPTERLENKYLAKKKFHLPQNDLIVTIVGRLDPIKDHLTYLRAALIVQQNLPSITFFIVGSRLGDFSASDNTYYKQIKSFLKNHPKLSLKVIFGGFVDNMAKVYHATNILVSSSISEVFPLTLIEAAACAVPIVATNNGGQKLIVKNSKTGFLVSPQKPALLAQKILKLVKDSKLREQFGRAGRRHIEKNFNLDNYSARIVKVYRTLTRFKPRSSQNLKVKI